MDRAEVCAAETRRSKMRSAAEMRPAADMRSAGATTAVPSGECGTGCHSVECNKYDCREYSSKGTQHG